MSLNPVIYTSTAEIKSGRPLESLHHEVFLDPKCSANRHLEDAMHQATTMVVPIDYSEAGELHRGISLDRYFIRS